MANGNRKGKRRRSSVRKTKNTNQGKDSGMVAARRDAVEEGIGIGTGLSDPDFCYYCHDYGHFDGKCLDVNEGTADWEQGKQTGAPVAKADALVPDSGADSSGGLPDDQDWRTRRLAFLRDQWERAERIRGLAQAFQKEIDQEEMWLRGNRYAKRPEYADGIKNRSDD